MFNEITKTIYEVTRAKSIAELSSFGGVLEQYSTKEDAMNIAKEYAKSFPYVYVEKCYMSGNTYEDSEFVWSHNPNRW